MWLNYHTARATITVVMQSAHSEVKRAITGQGHADKDQVAKMVQLLIGKREFETSDASDGLALAICHAHAAKMMVNQGSDYVKALQAASGRRPKRSMSLAECVAHRVKGK